MKTFYLTILITFLCWLNISAQTIKGTLSHSQIFRMNNEFIVSGFDDGKLFKLIRYDKNLAIIKTYSKQLEKSVNEKLFYLKITDNGIVCLFRDGILSYTGTVLKLTKNWEEVSYHVYTKKEKKEFLDEYALLSSYSSSSSLSDECFPYSNKLCLKSSATFRALPTIPENFELQNAAYDSILNGTIIVGNYFDPNVKVNKRTMKGWMIMSIDEHGNIIKSEKIDFPSSEKLKIYSNSNDMVAYVDTIIFLKSGNVAMICTNTVAIFYGGGPSSPTMGVSVPTQKMQWYVTVGFSYFQFDENLEIVSTTFYPFENKDYEGARFNSCSSDGRKILFGNVATSPFHDSDISSQTLYFPKTGNPYLKENYTYRGPGSFTTGLSDPFYYQFMVDDNTVITFRPDKRSYELKVVKLD